MYPALPVPSREGSFFAMPLRRNSSRRWPLSPQLRRTERLVAAGFAVAMGLVGWGGWSLWQSMLRHRATADETLRDHASYMAINYSSTFGSRTWFAVSGLLIAAQEAADAPGTWTTMDVTRRASEQRFETGKPELTPLRFFRGDSSGWSATTRDSRLDSLLTHRLNARLADSVDAGLKYRATVVARSGDTTIAILQSHHAHRGWVGYEVSLTDFRTAVLLPNPLSTQAFFEHALDSLPERWPPGTTVITPVAISVTTGDSLPLLTFNDPAAAHGWTMHEYALAAFSGRVEVTITPDAVPYLMPGGYPPTPGPRVALVIGLALALLSGVAVMAWRAVALSRMREEFTHAVSHELRTPLANIHLYAETLLLERIHEPAARRAALETITRETRRLGGMVENVLATARMARAEATLRPTPDRMGRLVHEVLDAFQPLFLSRSIDVEVELIGEEVATIDGDAMRRILVNLIDNAIRHGPEGQQLRVIIDHVGDEVLIVVEDEGPGIPPEERERVWHPYARGETGGSGLGLAVVRHLARLHGGDAEIREGSAGARVEVRLVTQPEVG